MRSLGVDPDPCDGPEPSKAKAEYRNYTDGKLLDRVYNTYLQMHTHQTVDFVRKKSAQYGSCSLRTMGAMEALDLLDQLVDESDPDVDFPNSFHAYQTAEGIRRAHPDKDWFHLVGLLHDLGKVLVLFGEPQVRPPGWGRPEGCAPHTAAQLGKGLGVQGSGPDPHWLSPQHRVRDVPAPLRPGERPHVLGTRWRSTWCASTPSTPGTRTGITGTSAPSRTCRCCPGCRSSTSSTSTPSRRSCRTCSSSGATTRA
ncbi:inositol oxygenase isoform X4 [Columba livia]|uniref:inositol oxygenase isoform X4 n=1 Tax=Columba livia TaxID=8932 RepID=UPI0031B9E021